MYGITLKEICDVCGGILVNSEDYTISPRRITIDSREVNKGDLFAAFRGEKSDGHSYINNAFLQGALCCLVEYVPEGTEGPCVLVKSTLDAVDRLAACFRAKLSMPVIGITGSVGKTTAKEMIASVLSEHYSVLKTDKNLNNQLGVPITISRIDERHNAAVVEMGVSKKGDMALLGSIVKPSVAVFTNIGHAHLEFLGSLEGVFSEKTSMLDYMELSGAAVVNGDDPYLAALECKQKKLSYGLSENCDVRGDNVRYADDGSSTSFEIVFQDKRVSCYVPAYGKHIVYAALMAFCVGMLCGLTESEIVSGLASFKTVGRRASLIKLGRFLLIDDCYNANPDSVKNSIDSMSALPGRHVCILGDMLELGVDSEKMHYDTGVYAAMNGTDLLLTSGKLSERTKEGAAENGCRAVHYENMDSLLEDLTNQLKTGDNVLVKASLGSGYARVSEFIKGIKYVG